MTILTTGANGNVSGALLRHLDTQNVRTLVRDPAKAPQGVPVAIGDLDHPDSLTSAFEGVEVLWLLTPMEPLAPHQNSNAVWAARQAGVRHVVRLSAIGAAYDAPTRNGRLHALSDAELAGSGLTWTIIKPAAFMQNLIGALVVPIQCGHVENSRFQYRNFHHSTTALVVSHEASVDVFSHRSRPAVSNGVRAAGSFRVGVDTFRSENIIENTPAPGTFPKECT